MEQTILTDDDTAYFVLRQTAGSRSLVAVTTGTGEEKWRREFWSTAVDPNVWFCGGDLCLVAYVSRTKLWRISRTDGSDVGDHDISAVRASKDVVLGIDRSEKSDATLLMASRGEVHIALFGRLGETRTWSKWASDLFGPTPVSPDGGWGSRRVEGGWLAWLGPVVDCCALNDPKSARFPPGAVASFDDRGISRWVAADRFLCETFQVPEAQPLCDGEARVVGSDEGTRPNIVEGRDALNGAVTWRLELNGEVDEAHHSRNVLRIDQNRYLVDLASGPVLLDVRSGPQPAPPDSPVGWCRTDFEVEPIKSTMREIPYTKTRHPFPCRLGGEQADPTLPIPEFAGVNVAGWGAWVEDGHVHAKRLPD